MTSEQVEALQELLTVEELAKRLSVKPSWVRDHASGRRGPKVPAIRLGGYWRFRWKSVQEWLEELEKAA